MAEFVNVTKKIFFDRQRVINAMDRKMNRVLSSTGAFARTVMKNGMRKRKAVSEPGAFPSSHAGQLRSLIYFGFDGKSVVVGPTLFKSKVDGRTIPDIVNAGGRVNVTTTNRKTGRKESKLANYRPRPFVDLTAPIAAKKLAENTEKFGLN